MNIADGRQSEWSPQILVISTLFHIAVLYAVAVAFKVIPPPIQAAEESTPIIQTYTPPPPIPQPDQPEIIKPEFQQHLPKPSPVPVTVPPTPLPPIPVQQTEGTPSIEISHPIAEQPVTRTAIRYPAVAEQQQIEGKVVLSITILPDGTVRDVRVVNARPNGVFESSAVQAVSKWRYRPSNAIRTNVIVEIDYVLG